MKADPKNTANPETAHKIRARTIKHADRCNKKQAARSVNKAREQICEPIELVKRGALSRRAFVSKMLLLGMSAPIAAQILNASGVAAEQPKSLYKPTKRGGGGRLKTLFWFAPTLLNPHFAVGLADSIGSRVFYEPLAEFDPDGNLYPILAAEIPTRANGGVAADGRTVVWKLKQGVKWHDGEPFTADDCVFNWEYARNAETAAVTTGIYKDVTVEKIDQQTIRVAFARPTPFWAKIFVASVGMIIPKHLFEGYIGSKSREAPTNLKPVGTGPYKFAEFVPGDIVRGDINTDYHFENRPHFDSIELKGGGDAVSAARAVLQTGEYDYAWGLLVEDEILRKFEEGGKGRVDTVLGDSTAIIGINFSDPWTEVDGERASYKTQHPILSDRAVRDALNVLLDRGSIAKFIYGRMGEATASFINAPGQFASKTGWEFNIDKANRILDAAGWVKGADGVRAKDGKKLKFLFQASINAPLQKTQAIFKQACQKAGIELELKSVPASVFLSSDVANPDTIAHFYSDLQMYTPSVSGPPDPELKMIGFVSWEIASKTNKWQGRNVCRWRNEEYDRMYRAAQIELDTTKRAALFVAMNDLLIKERVIIPVLRRAEVAGFNKSIRATLSAWASPFWLLHDWYRET
jgi:peptide/nickel transport system substrate-binding protein